MGTTSSRQDQGASSVQDEEEQSQLLGSREFWGELPAPGEYKSPLKQKYAIVGLILSNAFNIVAFHILQIWIPFAALSLEPSQAVNMMKAGPLISKAIVFGLSPLAGIITDSFMRKTRVLIVSTIVVVLGCVYLSATLMEVSAKLQCGPMRANETKLNCTINPLVMTDSTNLASYSLVYLIVICIISVAESFIQTILIVLAGDQMANRSQVQRLYGWYYWSWKTASVTSFAAAYLLLLNHDITVVLNAAAGMVLVCITFSLGFLLTVIYAKVTREPLPYIGVITDTVKMWQKAWENRKNRPDDVPFLAMASYTHYGDGGYPDDQVADQLRLGKLSYTLLLLLPYSFAAALPIVKDAGEDYIIDYIKSTYTYTATIGGSSVIVIPLLYGVIYCLPERFRPSLLHRIIAGIVAVIISSIFFLSAKDDSTLLATGICVGISNALAYTAGIELTFISAPRSMQSTAMGIFFSIDGVTDIVYLALHYGIKHPLMDKTYYQIYYRILNIVVGISLNVISVILFVVFRNKLSSGLHSKV